MRGDAEMPEHRFADEMRRATPRATDADVDARLAKVGGQKLRVAIGEMQQMDVAERRNQVDRVGRALRARAIRRERHTTGRGGGKNAQKLAPVHCTTIACIPPVAGVRYRE